MYLFNLLFDLCLINQLFQINLILICRSICTIDFIKRPILTYSYCETRHEFVMAASSPVTRLVCWCPCQHPSRPTHPTHCNNHRNKDMATSETPHVNYIFEDAYNNDIIA